MNIKNKIITALILLITIGSTAQVEHNWYVGIGIDPSMAINGPGYSYSEQSSLNIELRGGIEFNHYRFGLAYETHKVIGYRKFTWLQVDYILRDFPLKNFNSYAGLEGSIIKRNEKLFPERYHSKTAWLNPGANVELQYNIPKTYISVGAGLNLFRAESTLIRDGKQFRYDGMISIYWKFY